MILRCEHPNEAREFCAGVRQSGLRLGFVPTMGALHEGHLTLVERACAENDRCCVSVFVNPLQFNERADFERYPRDFDRDARMLERAGCTMAFTGTLETFFPGETSTGAVLAATRLREPGPAALGLEGAMRPGHFAGVATIVERLFEITRPSVAYFGQKDFQQTLVVQHLARRLGYPKIEVCPTSREPSGLARSSRNEFLSPAERMHATALYRALQRARAAWEKGEREPVRLRASMLAELERAPVSLEYAEVRDPAHWTADAPRNPLERAVALIAARVGTVRLIDNSLLHEAEPRP